MLGTEKAATAPSGDQGTGLDRRGRRRAATKAEILDAAWALARSEGLTTFSMRDVAARVGMQAPSLYQYFDSKLAIFDAMFEQGARQSLETVCADLPATAEPSEERDLLLLVARRVFDFATSDRARMQLLFQRTIPGFEPSPASYAPSVEMSGTVQRYLVELGYTDPDAMDLFTAMVAGLVNQQMSNDPGGSRWARLLERTVDMFIAEMAPTRVGERSSHGTPARKTAKPSTAKPSTAKPSTSKSSTSKRTTRTTTAKATTANATTANATTANATTTKRGR